MKPAPIITPERAAKRANRLVQIEVASDFYKDVFGHRPDIYGNKSALRAYRSARVELARLKATPEGRARLRADGWTV